MEELDKHKALIGFKCNPLLRLSLCEQAERVGVTLSSYVETIVSSYKNQDDWIKELSGEVKGLQAKVEFYENPFLNELYNRFSGQNITYYDREGVQTVLKISTIADIYTIIINSFKIDE